MTEGSIGRQTQEKKLHVFVLLSIIVLTFIIYFSRLFSLQVIEGETYRTRSRTISSQVNTLSAHRGEIFDRIHLP